MRLQDKIALITGGAYGMGGTTAKLFAQEGATVLIADQLADEGALRVQEIEAADGHASFHRMDVTSDENWAAVVAEALAAHGRIDILVNNAGISGSAYDDPLDLDAWYALMDVNATGVFLGHRNVIPVMRERGGGTIVNIASISGNVGQDVVHHGYNASKGAVRILTKSAAVRHAPEGIRVNTVHPGLMPPMRTSGATSDPAVRERMLKRVPMGRFGLPEEVARAVLFLASDESSHTTGSELHVDGGYLAA